MWGIDITLWFSLLLAYSERFVFSWRFSFGNSQTWTQDHLISKQKPNCFGYIGLHVLNSYNSLKESKVKVKSHFYFQSEKLCFKVTDRETNKERGTVYFQLKVNPICTFSYVNLIFVFIFAVNHCTRFNMCLCVLLLSLTLFIFHFLLPCEVSECIMCVSLPL